MIFNEIIKFPILWKLFIIQRNIRIIWWTLDLFSMQFLLSIFHQQSFIQRNMNENNFKKCFISFQWPWPPERSLFCFCFCIFFIEIELLNHKFGDIYWSSINCLKYHKTSTKNTEWSKQFNYIMVFWIRPFLWLWLAKFEITKFWIVNHVHFLFLWSSLHYYSLCLYLSFKETNNAKCFSR